MVLGAGGSWPPGAASRKREQSAKVGDVGGRSEPDQRKRKLTFDLVAALANGLRLVTVAPETAGVGGLGMRRASPQSKQNRNSSPDQGASLLEFAVALMASFTLIRKRGWEDAGLVRATETLDALLNWYFATLEAQAGYYSVRSAVPC